MSSCELSSKTSPLEVLSDENRCLLRDLKICDKLLENFRNCLIVFNNDCICEQNVENKQKLKQLDNYYHFINDRFVTKYGFTRHRTTAADDPEDDDRHRVVDTNGAEDINNDCAINEAKNSGNQLNPNRMDTSSAVTSGEDSSGDRYDGFDNIFDDKTTRQPTRERKSNRLSGFPATDSDHKLLEPIVIVDEEPNEPKVTAVPKKRPLRQNVGKQCATKATVKRKKSLKSFAKKLCGKSKLPEDTGSDDSSDAMATIVCDEIGCEGKTFKTLRNLDKHKRTIHSGVRPYQCQWPACEAMFKTREALTDHKAVHLDVRHFVCPTAGCHKSFKLRQTLTQHMRTHQDKTQRTGGAKARFACTWPACGHVSLSGQQLTDHMNRHQRIRPFQCTQCEQTFYTAFDLRNHSAKYHNTSDAPAIYNCDYEGCDKTFVTVRDLKLHRRRHGDLSSFVCSWPECGQRFNCNQRLTEHHNIHLNVKAFVCDFVGCGKSYFQKKGLNRHIKKSHAIPPQR